MDKLKTEKINRKKKKKKNFYLPWTFELADVFYLIIPRGWQTRLLITLPQVEEVVHYLLLNFKCLPKRLLLRMIKQREKIWVTIFPLALYSRV